MIVVQTDYAPTPAELNGVILFERVARGQDIRWPAFGPCGGFYVCEQHHIAVQTRAGHVLCPSRYCRKCAGSGVRTEDRYGGISGFLCECLSSMDAPRRGVQVAVIYNPEPEPAEQRAPVLPYGRKLIND
jgi:hypothetical protein